jgi:NAD-dependent SIR2 family protein deacetylase
MNMEEFSGRGIVMDTAKIQKLQEIIDGSDNIVFFGGAGVSTESGIPDFRSQDGLYHMKYDYPPETIISHTFSCGNRRNSTVFIRIRCWPWTRSRTPPTESLPSWNRRAS